MGRPVSNVVFTGQLCAWQDFTCLSADGTGLCSLSLSAGQKDPALRLQLLGGAGLDEKNVALEDSVPCVPQDYCGQCSSLTVSQMRLPPQNPHCWLLACPRHNREVTASLHLDAVRPSCVSRCGASVSSNPVEFL